MGFATAGDGVRLYFEETGTGTPVIFVHEFGDNYRSWEPQVRRFARTRRCITFAARGYPRPTCRATRRPTRRRSRRRTSRPCWMRPGSSAHVVGCSMGGFAALHFGLDHADRALSIVAAGAGYGAEKQHEEYFRNISLTVARNFEEIGAERFAETYGSGASRVQFQNKNPRGWREFVERLAQHSAAGAAATMRGVQVRRPSLYDLADRFARMAAPPWSSSATRTIIASSRASS